MKQKTGIILVGLFIVVAIIFISTKGEPSLAYIPNASDGTISVIDIIKQQETKTIKAGDGTHGLELSPDGKFLYASNRSSNDLVKLNLENYEITKRVVTGETANHVSYVPGDDKLYVTKKIPMIYR